MGLLDIPAPLFSAVDSVLSTLPLLVRLLLWAVVTAIISMYLYWLCSAQERIGEAKRRAISARRNMAAYGGHEFSEMWPLATESLVASGKHFIVVLGPALLSSLPALTLIIWVSNHYSYSLPAASTVVGVQSVPTNSLPGDQFVWPASDANLNLTDATGQALVTLPLGVAVPVVHKRQWWNSLIGNPNGYLADTAVVEEVRFDLPQINYLNIGPAWVRTWEFSYFVMLIICSLGIKVAFRIH